MFFTPFSWFPGSGPVSSPVPLSSVGAHPLARAPPRGSLLLLDRPAYRKVRPCLATSDSGCTSIVCHGRTASPEPADRISPGNTRKETTPAKAHPDREIPGLRTCPAWCCTVSRRQDPATLARYLY